MRETLIRYLLGELDSDERRELRTKLRSSPDLQRELAHLRECFAANREEECEPLPPGRLAERTAERISNSDEYELELASRRAGTMTSSGDAQAGVLGWSLADLAVAGGVMIAVSMLLFPALRDSRDGARLTHCQRNQSELYFLISKFAADRGGYYPIVQPNEPAGIFVAKLVRDGYVDSEEVTKYLICPDSSMADAIRSGAVVFRIPTRAKLQAMSPAEFRLAGSKMSPSYTYALPPKVGDGYQFLRGVPYGHSGRDPILGDNPAAPHDALRSHHRGSVLQVITMSGNIISFAADAPPLFGGDKDLYHNDLGIVAAGIGPNDIVLAPTNAMGGLELVSQGR
jgi:hypothetical protein